MPLRARVPSPVLPLALLALWGCSHSEPFQDPNENNNGPFSPVAPVQLTYNPGQDLTPAFLPGDTIVLYSYEQKGALNPNTCLGALPAPGGTRLSDSCPRSAAALDSTERYESAVPLNDSIVVMVQSFRLKGNGFDSQSLLGTAPWRAADHLVPRQDFPFASASGVFEVSAGYLSPIGSGNLAYVAITEVSACPGSDPFCPQPTLLRIGRQVSLLNLEATGDPSVAPGTDYATSAAPGRSPGSFLFTLPFDSRVYERQGDGSTVTVFDFGADSVARDPTIVGNDLVAIVGGNVARWTSNDGVPLQVDGGGNIVRVTLGNGTTQYLTATPIYRRPAVSADGSAIVAEGNLGLEANLFRFDLP